MEIALQIRQPGRGQPPQPVQRPSSCPRGHVGKIHLHETRPNGTKSGLPSLSARRLFT